MKYRITKTKKRGVTVWCLDIAATPDKPRERIFRSTRVEVEQVATDRFGEIKNFGPELTNFSYRERQFLRHWLDRMPIDQLEAVMTNAVGANHDARTVAEAVQAYQDAPRSRPIKERHRTDLRLRLSQFCGVFGEQVLTTIKTGPIEDYIHGWGGSAPNHYRILRGFFNYCARREWITRNPIVLIKSPNPQQAEKLTLSPEQMIAALRFCTGVDGPRSEPLLATLIFGGFCGLRNSEVMRLDYSKVSTVGAGEIHVAKMKTEGKGTSERYVTPTANALEWLLWLQMPEAGQIIAIQETSLKRPRKALIEHLGIPEWPHNVMRRSFASYHLAAFGDAALTAEQMGHTDASTTKGKYAQARRKDVADAWFAITPAVLGQSSASGRR